MTTGIVFGTFDGLHDGHRAMLKEARQHADTLVVALPSDKSVYAMKARLPKTSWADRRQALIDSGLIDHVVLGDEEPGTYTVLNHVKPDMIMLGYDQDGLRKDLERFLQQHAKDLTIVTLHPFEPERYKSSLLNSI